MQKQIIEYSSSAYPEKLRELENPPTRLYAIGDIEILKRNGIAVVGSRTNTEYGKKMCQEFTKQLVEYNFTIISGLAVGIDSIAHKECLNYCGKTIAVLPSGLNNITPKQNIELANKIIKNGGLLITEYEDNIESDSKKFLERNRIVAGLSDGTLVVEAGYRSGTSVTARYTRNLKRPVFCIPSSLENKKGRTTNELIKKGDKLITGIDDILEEFPNMNFQKNEIKRNEKEIDIPEDLKNVYKVISDKPKEADEISRECQISIQEVNSKLLLLELGDYIEEIPGKGYIRKDEN